MGCRTGAPRCSATDYSRFDTALNQDKVREMPHMFTHARLYLCAPVVALHLILEVSGRKKKEKEAKVQTAKTMWVPGVNNLGTLGRWAFLEIDGSNLHKTKQEIRKLLRGGVPALPGPAGEPAT